MRRMGRFLRDRDGNIAIMFAFTFVLLVLFAGGAVDFARYNAVRADLIESLDASGLAIAQLDAINGPEIRNLSDAEREAYLKQYGRDFFHENFRHESVIEGLSVDFEIDNVRITPTAQGELRTLLLHLGADLLGDSGPRFETLSMASNTEITRAATGDTEVALVLDTTGSMNSEGRMTDLKAAANEFVDVLIRDDQSEFTSKVAIVPYGMAVNLGAKAQSVRGPVEPGFSITAATRARPVVVTAPGHDFTNNQIVYITGVNGMTQLNDKAYRVRSPTADTFELQTVSGANVDGRSYSAYAGGGTAYCTDTGCEYKFFTSQANTQKVFRVSTCASERTGGNAYRAIVLPETRHIPPQSFAALLELARRGATVIVERRLPADVPGFDRLDARRKELAALTAQLRFGAEAAGVQTARIGSGRNGGGRAGDDMAAQRIATRADASGRRRREAAA